MKQRTVFEDQFSEEVWNQTYKDHNDKTIDDMITRIAGAIASVEATPELQAVWKDKFIDMMSGFKVVPAGRILSNAGTEWSGTTLMNCFVGPRATYDIDSIEGICSHLLSQIQTLKSEGGWGENFSYIRPRGSFIHGIGVETPGAIKYMEMFDKSSEIITSGSGKKSGNKKAKGKIRKGAQMGVLDISHPDVLEFITAKQQPGRLTKFNISVNVSDIFMGKIIKVRELLAAGKTMNDDEVKAADKWDLIFPETTFHAYKAEWTGDIKLWISKGYPVHVYSTVSATWLWDLIMQSTYNRAEPGVLFLDRANDLNELNYAETIYATNPCVAGDTLVSTSIGNIRIDELATRFNNGENLQAKTYNIKNKQCEFENIVFADKTRQDAELIEIELDNITLRLTPDHKVYTENRGYVEAQYLTEEDILLIEQQ